MNIMIDNCDVINDVVKKDISTLSDSQIKADNIEIKIPENNCVNTSIVMSSSKDDQMFPLEDALKVINEAVIAVEKVEVLVKNMDIINIDNFTEKVCVYIKTALECLAEASTEFRFYYKTCDNNRPVKNEVNGDNNDHTDRNHYHGDHTDHISDTGDHQSDVEELKDDDLIYDEKENELFCYPDIVLKTEIEESPLSPHQVCKRIAKSKLKKYSCDECIYSCKTKALMTKHKKLKHCTEEIAETELKSDGDIKNGEYGESFCCTQCEYSSTNQKNFRIHMKNQHSADKQFCSQCQYFCNNLKELKHHIAVHHDGVRYSCDECNYTAKYINNLREHKISKHLGITYSCDICGMNVKQKRNLKKHKEKLHPPPTSTKLHPPPTPTSSTTTSTAITTADANTTDSDMFYCSECPQVFTTTKGLNRHVKDIHVLKRYGENLTTNQPNKKLRETYSCNICDYSVTNLSSWKMHMKKHGPNLIFCDQCDYSTHNKYSFKVHQNQHLGEMFYCDQCSYKSHTRINLRRHVDVKHTKQQHACDQCTFTSFSRHYLGNHIKKQHQEKRYQCDKCNYSAAYPSDLKAHIDAIHNKIRHECSLCDFSAPYKGDLNRHRKTVHPLAAETEPSRE